jgi:hypothetical protein
MRLERDFLGEKAVPKDVLLGHPYPTGHGELFFVFPKSPPQSD